MREKEIDGDGSEDGQADTEDHNGGHGHRLLFPPHRRLWPPGECPGSREPFLLIFPYIFFNSGIVSCVHAIKSIDFLFLEDFYLRLFLYEIFSGIRFVLNSKITSLSFPSSL